MTDPTLAWRPVKFGDVVRLVNDRCDPAKEGLERYVGLEHVEPGDFRVRRWGLVSEGTTFTNRFRAGQVLFGKRRAYQRKVAIADFDGVCSGDIYVFESANGALLPQLLPFICQSEGFFDYAVKTSAGSLSPRTNWRSLAQYEFGLPPPEEQLRIAVQLQSVSTAEQLAELAATSLSDLRAALSEHWATALSAPQNSRGSTDPDQLPSGWRLRTIRELCTGNGAALTLGPFGSDLVVSDYGVLKCGTPVLFVADVQRFKLVHVSGKFISAKKHEQLKAHEALPGDVLVTEMGWPPGEACVVPEDWPASVIKADIIRARVNKSLVLPDYLAAILNSHWGQRQVCRIAPGTTRPRMTLRDFEKILIVVPPPSQQEILVSRLQTITTAVEALDVRSLELNAIRDAIAHAELSSTRDEPCSPN
jgi:type I restriction enzyme S subunit